MKKIALYASLLLAACNSPKGENAETADKQSINSDDGTAYVLDSTSSIEWAASKPTATHHGTFKVTEGTFMVKDEKLTGGNFKIEISSLNVTDPSAKDGKEKLEGHLKSPDFFDVSKHPSAFFEITKVEPVSSDTSAAAKDATHMVSGNLTLREITKNISFPAKVTIDANSLSAKAEFKIDRTIWGMNYKGPNNPLDWFISKEVNLKLDLTASKK